MLTRIAIRKARFIAAVGVTAFVAMTNVPVFGADTASGSGKGDGKNETPSKPLVPRPERPGGNAKAIIEDFKQQKERFLNEQKAAKDAAKDLRDTTREEVNTHAAKAVRTEAKDSIAAAKDQAREQARKVADEAKEQGKGERRRD